MADNSVGFSCQTCRQRKVRCDKTGPSCSNCIKASVTCEYVAPVRGKRKRTKPIKEGMHAKLERYEKLLRSYGAHLSPGHDEGDSTDEENMPPAKRPSNATNTASPAIGKDVPSPVQDTNIKVVRKDGSSRYFDHSFWSRVDHEFQDTDQSFVDAVKEGIGIGCAPNPTRSTDPLPQLPHDADTDESDIVLGICPEIQDLVSLHPPLETIQHMWDIYLERVDPLVKLLHTPTFWTSFRAATQQPHNVTKDLEALIFAVYAAILNAMDEEECMAIMRDNRIKLVKKYRQAARQALINANFIKTSSLTTLQAYMIFLLGKTGVYQSDSFFILSGIAVRLARRMGLHRDGAALGFPPFETEMRRRLWWAIVCGDYRSSEFSGTKPSMDLVQADTKSMLNIEDEDLTPEMTESPPERTGITVGILALMRCDLTDFLRSLAPGSPYDIYWDRLIRTHLTPDQKDKKIDELEDLVESKYVRYCDPSNPLHLFASILARSALCKIRLFAHNPRQFADRGEKVPQHSRDVIWKNGTKMLDYGNIMHTNPTMKRFTWQLGTSYLWDTLLYVLIETRHRKSGPDVDKMWKSTGSIFENYPQIFDSDRNTLYVAIGNWTLQVWDECAKARREDGLPDQLEPSFVRSLREIRKARAQPSTASAKKTDPGEQTPATNDSAVNTGGEAFAQDPMMDLNLSGGFDDFGSYDFADLLSFDLDPNGWVQFDQLLGHQRA